MKIVALLFAAVVAVAQPGAQEFRLSNDGVGPIVVTSTIKISGRDAHLHATAVNDSGQSILYADLCVLAPQRKKASPCAFRLRTAAVWAASSRLEWDFTSNQVTGSGHQVTIMEIVKDLKLYHVRKVYVADLAGTDAAIAREELAASLVTGGRFELVEMEELADAVLKGRAELKETGSSVATSEATDQRNRAGATGIGSAIGTSAVIGTAAGSSRSSSTATGSTVTRPLVESTVLVRLVDRSGAALWAWDDTKMCFERKTHCAMKDLAKSATWP